MTARTTLVRLARLQVSETDARLSRRSLMGTGFLLLAACADSTAPPRRPLVASVTVAPAAATMMVGDTLRLVATLRDSADNTLIDRAVTWTSSNSAVATVSATGLVSGVRADSLAATITATSESVSGSAAIRVTTPVSALVTVTAVSPASGPLAGGTSVTITGTSFVNVTSVTIGGTELVGRTVVSTTEITGTAPASTSSGARDVVVTSASHGGGTCSACFTYNPSVTVTAVSPASGPLAGGTSVTITGTNFANVISVTIDGVELASRTVVSATEITGTTPTATAAGAKDAVVTSSSHGSGTCVSCFTYVSYVVEWASVSAGWQFTCGLLTTGAAYCWGYNGLGRLGNGSTQPSFNPLPVAVTGGFTFSAVSAGLMHACGVTGGGAAYCWGDNRYGALGNGLQNGFDSVPGAVTGGLTFGAVTAGYEYTCGLTREGAAYCWGWNGGGLLGTGSTADIIRVPEAVSGGLTLAAVAAGYFAHTCGLTTGGAAYCWGDNGNGQLGDGSTSYSVVPVAVSGGLTFAAVSAGGGHSCGLTTGGAAYCWGANGVGELGTGSTTSSLVPVPVSGGLRFSALAAGEGYSCAITSAGAAYCWGWNDWGQLGDGSTTNRLVPVLVTGGYTFTAVHAGYQHACGVTASGAAYCWGRGQEGQLGNGTTTTSSSVPVRVVDPP